MSQTAVRPTGDRAGKPQSKDVAAKLTQAHAEEGQSSDEGIRGGTQDGRSDTSAINLNELGGPASDLPDEVLDTQVLSGLVDR
jgi:hypothetical protein